MDHELAHGLYYTNKEYKKNCDSLISEMKKRDYNFVKKALINIGYLDNKKIIDDEIQAFLSSELYKTFNTNEIKEYSKKFKSNFKKFKNEF
jgi:predicted unusual protein kinase regulating ubiquinone biosynthesis (AarF/ABC1/UbiB family)